MATANIAPAEIRAELARRGMTREQLAEASGVSFRTLTRRLRLSRPEPFRLDELDAIAAVFGCSPADLIRDSANGGAAA